VSPWLSHPPCLSMTCFWFLLCPSDSQPIPWVMKVPLPLTLDSSAPGLSLASTCCIPRSLEVPQGLPHVPGSLASRKRADIVLLVAPILDTVAYLRRNRRQLCEMQQMKILLGRRNPGQNIYKQPQLPLLGS
jgi:hypothetical protein